MDALAAVDEERKLAELKDLHESILLDEAYFNNRNLTGKGRNVLPTAKQRRDVQHQASLLRFSTLSSLRRRSTGSVGGTGSEDVSLLDAEDHMMSELDLTAKPRTFVTMGPVVQYDPDKYYRKNTRRYLFLFNDLLVLSSPRDAAAEAFDVSMVLHVKDLRLRHSHTDVEEEKLSFDLIVAKTRQRPQSELRFICEDGSAWRQWVDNLENTLLAYHRQTEIARHVGWFHDIIQGNFYSAAYLGDVALLRGHLKRLADPSARPQAIDLPDDSGMTALHWTVLRGHEVCARLLLDRGAEVDVKQKGLNTPLLLAAASGHDHLARLLLLRGADIKVVNHRGFNAVFMAVLCGHASKGLPWLLQLLHARGLDLNYTDRSGATPLHLCAERNLARPVRMLVDAGADVNARHAVTQLTPLQMACSSKSPDVETIRSFLDQGAYPNWKDFQGRTAFDLAIKSLPTQASGGLSFSAPPPAAMVYSATHGPVDVNEVLLSPGGSPVGENGDGSEFTGASSAAGTERWRPMEATLNLVGDWVVRTLPALLELSKRGSRFDPVRDLQDLRPSVRAAVLEAHAVWEKKAQPENFGTFVRTRELSGEDLRLHRTVWSRDDTSPICQLCADAFSLTNRRHHCRACGVLTCDRCSTKRLRLSAAAEDALLSPGGSNSGKERSGSRKDDGMERVCDGCFNRLLYEASLPSLDHFRVRQLKKCALDVVQSLQDFIERLDGPDAGTSVSGLLSTPQSQASNALRRASLSPQPSFSSPPGGGITEDLVVATMKLRQGHLLDVENVVAKFLEVSLICFALYCRCLT